MDSLLREFKNAPLVSYSDGHIINQKNAKNSMCVFCVQYGYVKAYTISNAGDEHVLVLLRRKDVFPLAPLVFKDGGSQKIFYEALGRVKLLQLTKEHLSVELDKHLNIATAMLVQMSERFLTSGQHTENLLGKSARQKLIYSLQFLATRYGHKQGDSSFLDPIFTHKFIASTIGLTRGTVTKEFDKLRLKNLITTTSGRIRIVSMRLLSKEYGEPFTIAA